MVENESMQTFLGRRSRALACAVSLCRSCWPCRAVPPRIRPTRWSRGTAGCSRSTETVDVHVLKPVAEGYVKVTPLPARTGVRNFFGNIGDVWSSVNLFLQGRLEEGLQQARRPGRGRPSGWAV